MRDIFVRTYYDKNMFDACQKLLLKLGYKWVTTNRRERRAEKSAYIRAEHGRLSYNTRVTAEEMVKDKKLGKYEVDYEELLTMTENE